MSLGNNSLALSRTSHCLLSYHSPITLLSLFYREPLITSSLITHLSLSYHFPKTLAQLSYHSHIALFTLTHHLTSFSKLSINSAGLLSILTTLQSPSLTTSSLTSSQDISCGRFSIPLARSHRRRDAQSNHGRAPQQKRTGRLHGNGNFFEPP
jgi:hypothetical protein